MKITQHTFTDYFPQSQITYQTIVSGPFIPMRKMRIGNSFNTIRYITPEDIINAFTARLAAYDGPKKDDYISRWEYIIETSENLIKEEEQK